MVLLARDGRAGMELKTLLEDYVKSEVVSSDSGHDSGVNDCILNHFTWHSCEPVEHGLVIDIVDTDGDEL